MGFTNGEKNLHGLSAQSSLESILQSCVDLGYIKSVVSNYRIGRDGYASNEQFYAPFLIEFQDSCKWVLFTTTSMRTDRIKGQQWDAINLKSIDSQIDYAYLVYPDGLKDSDENSFVRQGNKYRQHIEYSAIDDIVSQNKIFHLIESYHLKDKTTGQQKDIQGNNFENRIARILTYASNLNKWKANAQTIEGMHYDSFVKIVDCLNLDPGATNLIEATADKSVIGKLPSGGNPKTDVLVFVTNNDGSKNTYTISCKRSSNTSVSVHQYTAESFSNVLDPSNVELKTLLIDFQKAGSMKQFGEEKCQELEAHLKPYIEKLSYWVLGGQNGDGNPETQWADYILTYDNNEGDISMHRIAEYYNMLISKTKPSNFGTPFSWTYPSKRRGLSIQLKCKILK